MSDKPCLLAALWYAGRGWRVVPEAPGKKHPWLERWQETASTSEAEILYWWSNREDSGVGIATGAGSGVFVFDVDPGHGGDASLAALVAANGPLPETPSVRTGGGGTHHYFRWPGFEVRNSAGRLGPGLDVRGNGGQVVAPPTIHPETGVGYEWETEPDVILADAPGWLLDLLRPAVAARPPAPAVSPTGAPPERYAAKCLDNAVRAVAGAVEGTRNATLASVAYQLGQYAATAGIVDSAAVEALVARSLASGLDEKEARRTAGKCYEAGKANPKDRKQGPGRPPGFRDLAPPPGDEDWSDPAAAPGPDEPDVTPPEYRASDAAEAAPSAVPPPPVAVEEPAGVVKKKREKKPPPVSVDDRPPHPADDPNAEPEQPTDFDRGDDLELGLALIERLGGPSKTVSVEGAMWVAEGETWVALPPEQLRNAVDVFAGTTCRGLAGKPKRIEIMAGRRVAVAAVACDRASSPDFFSGAPAGAAFSDSFVRIDGTGLVYEPLRRSHRVRADCVSPYSLPAKGRAPVFASLLRDSWAGADDIEERYTYLLEWIGAALLGITTRWKDSPLLVGPKDTGKSRVVDAVLGLFPVSSRRYATLHSLSTEFGAARLVGGRINAASELPARELLDEQTAKAILSGNPVDVCRKYEQPFSFTSRCAHIYAANEIPHSLDAALRERFVVLDCPNRVPAARQDPCLGAKLEEEAPGIAAAALSCAEDLLARGRFVRPSSSMTAVEEWAVQSDSVALWALERLRESATRMSGQVLYANYRGWCEENGHRSLASNKWAIRLRACGYERMRSNGTWWMAVVLTGPALQAERAWGMRHD